MKEFVGLRINLPISNGVHKVVLDKTIAVCYIGSILHMFSIM